MKKGFTLIELVIVIGILAILAVVAILVLNPAQMLAQARDSQRVSDLGSVKSAIALYLATANSPTVNAGPACTVTTTTSPFTLAGNGCGSGSAVTSTLVDGTGWVKVNLNGTNGGSPLAALPIDPTQDINHFYAYAASSTAATFELDTVLESTKYSSMMTSDGGDKGGYYEVGTYSGLSL